MELGALQAREILASVRPRDVAGETLRRIAADDPADLIAILGDADWLCSVT